MHNPWTKTWTTISFPASYRNDTSCPLTSTVFSIISHVIPTFHLRYHFLRTPMTHRQVMIHVALQRFRYHIWGCSTTVVGLSIRLIRHAEIIYWIRERVQVVSVFIGYTELQLLQRDFFWKLFPHQTLERSYIQVFTGLSVVSIDLDCRYCAKVQDGWQDY